MIYLFLQKELLLLFRKPSQYLQSLGFFILLAAIFPLTLNQEANLLARIAPGVIWIAVVLAVMLSMLVMFAADKADGSLTQMLLSPLALPAIVLIKVGVHWVAFSLPLILVSPMIGLMFHLQMSEIGMLLLSLIIATPSLHMLGAFVAALSVGLRQANFLLPLILLPLFVPILIFATGVVRSMESESIISTPLLLLSATSVFVMGLMPFFTSMALRISVNYEQ